MKRCTRGPAAACNLPFHYYIITLCQLFADRDATLSGRPRTQLRRLGDCDGVMIKLRYELFRGRLSEAAFRASETNLADFIKPRGNTNPHLAELLQY
jgi:hypothetical protein